MGMGRLAMGIWVCWVGCAGTALQVEELPPPPPDGIGEWTETDTVQVEELAQGLGRPVFSGESKARWEMNSLEELAADWWHWSNASTTFDQGIATIGGGSYEEWMQRTDRNQSLWWETIDNGHGFRIEARMRFLEGGCGGVGLWIHDGTRLLKVFFCEDSVGVGYPFRDMVPVDARQFRRYTIEGRGNWIRLLVDGEVVLERQGPETMTGGGSATLTFGNLGGASGTGQWDWLSYDTRPELVEPVQRGQRRLSAR